MNNSFSDHELIRMKFWTDVWIAVANASNSKYTSTPTRWADEALLEFDNRFKEPAKDSK